jgi:hypothetical protein
MIVHRYTKSQGWTAVARFPHAINPYKYHEYDYRGFGRSPQEATNSLMGQLEANTYVYDYIYFIPERLTRYSPATYYDEMNKIWCAKMEYQQKDGGDTDIALVFGATPHDAHIRLASVFTQCGAYIPPNQRRAAEDLFSLDDSFDLYRSPALAAR